MDGFKTSRMRPLREGERKEKKKEKNEMKTKKKKAQEFECLSNADVDRILMATLYIGELNSGVGGEGPHIRFISNHLTCLFICLTAKNGVYLTRRYQEELHEVAWWK